MDLHLGFWSAGRWEACWALSRLLAHEWTLGQLSGRHFSPLRSTLQPSTLTSTKGNFCCLYTFWRWTLSSVISLMIVPPWPAGVLKACAHWQILWVANLACCLKIRMITRRNVHLPAKGDQKATLSSVSCASTQSYWINWSIHEVLQLSNFLHLLNDYWYFPNVLVQIINEAVMQVGWLHLAEWKSKIEKHHYSNI